MSLRTLLRAFYYTAIIESRNIRHPRADRLARLQRLHLRHQSDQGFLTPAVRRGQGNHGIEPRSTRGLARACRRIVLFPATAISARCRIGAGPRLPLPTVVSTMASQPAVGPDELRRQSADVFIA